MHMRLARNTLQGTIIFSFTKKKFSFVTETIRRVRTKIINLSDPYGYRLLNSSEILREFLS